jgi:RNA polymerase sigma-70 factor (ECF subfamily)
MSLSTEHVWQEMSQKLRQFFRHRLGDADLAEDLLQETFVRIHNGLASLQESERLAAWVYRIAHHTLIDHMRKEHTARPAPTLELASGAPAENYNEVVGGWLGQMVQNLPAPYRTAVTLAELDGVTQREVSTRLGLSLSGAKSRVQRGREKLKAMLLDCCHIEMDRRGNVVDYSPRRACSTCFPPGTATASCQPQACL